MIQDDIQNKFGGLLEKLPKRSLVAFSAGVDSTFLLAAAARAGDTVALIADIPFLPRRELDAARDLAKELDVELIEQPVELLHIPDVTQNGPKRCYYCKKALFMALQRTAERLDRVLLEGTNADDLEEYRPGRQALEELKIAAPLLDWSKNEIREMSRLLELPTADKPAMACLATRLSMPLTLEALSVVEAGEDILHDRGFPDVRLRHHGDIARLELPPADMRRALENSVDISDLIKGLGFRYATLDMVGYRRGNMTIARPEV